MKGYNPTAFSVDAHQRVYCGTWDRGLFKSDDGGQTWDKIDATILHDKNIMSLACHSNLEGKSGYGKLFVGTEPRCLFVLNDTDGQWEEINNLLNLKSSSWSFPPRPWTHHVRWIEPDKNKEDYLFVAIEAGDLIQSHDGGKSWIDRASTGPYDTHTLLTHEMAPARLYSATGDGFFECQDYGQSWQKTMNGLEHT